MKYRAEIDGLRALAILPVILFHAGFEWFSGGFVGVDVFFVISGYLITTIIISEIDEGSFSLIDFYERRARRILPALFFVMLICVPFAWLWFIPSDLKDFGKSLIAVSIFSSNILFWLENDYFGIAAELTPLLHTWSLAVEEQFYILFPVFLLLIWRLGLSWVLLVLLIVFFVSLGIGQWGSLNKPIPAFFLLPARAWELLIGVFAAFHLKRNAFLKSVGINQILSLSGLGMILCAIAIFDESTPFPGLYALLPAVGTGLIILSAVPRTIVHQLLSFSPIVKVGLLSYSAYLWHQPVLVFARHKSTGELTDLLLVFLCIMSLVLGYVSWKWVEAPFRDKKKINRKVILGFSLVGMVFFSSVGFLLSTNTVKSPNRIPDINYTSMGDKVEKEGYVCTPTRNIDITSDAFYCEFGSLDSEKSVILYGDSHSGAISYELDRAFKKNKIKGIWINKIVSNDLGCETTIFTIDTFNTRNATNLYKDCSDSFQRTMDVFDESRAIIIISRWTMKYYPVEGLIDNVFFNNKELNCKEHESYKEFAPINKEGLKLNTVKNKEEAIRSFLSLLPSDRRNILIYPIPETACDTYKVNLKYYKKTGFPLNELSFPVAEYDLRNQFVIDQFDSYVSSNFSQHIVPLRLRDVFCNTFKVGACSIIYNTDPLYLDDDHLSNFGARLITDEVIKILNSID